MRCTDAFPAGDATRTGHGACSTACTGVTTSSGVGGQRALAQCLWVLRAERVVSARSASAPGERRVAGRVQVAAAVTAEPERRQQFLALAQQLPGDQRPDPDHLVPMIGVGDDVGVLVEHVEDGETVRRERADTAGRLVAVCLALPLEPLMAVG